MIYIVCNVSSTVYDLFINEFEYVYGFDFAYLFVLILFFSF